MPSKESHIVVLSLAYIVSWTSLCKISIIDRRDKWRLNLCVPDAVRDKGIRLVVLSRSGKSDLSDFHGKRWYEFFFWKKKLGPYIVLFSEYIRALFYLFLLKGKVCTRKMSVNRKLVYFEFFSFFRGIFLRSFLAISPTPLIVFGILYEKYLVIWMLWYQIFVYRSISFT